jgi:hypothetical protein
MAVNFENLVVQGRAKAPGVLWSNEEWAAVCLLTKEFNIERTVAADFVRNGIKTVENYKKAVKAEFVPQTLEEATKEVAKAMEAKGAEIVKKPKSKKKTK